MSNGDGDAAPRRSLPFGRLVAELFVIVLGVFLALTADAWWADRVERGEERAALRQLLSDFDANAASLDSIVVEDQGIIASGYELLRMSSGTPQAPSPQRVAELVFDIVGVWTFDPVMGGLNSLISSGRLHLIRNDELRVALAGWPDHVADLNENERQEWDNTYLHLLPHLQQRDYWESILRSAGALSALPGGNAPNRILSLLEDRYFMNMVADRVSNVEWILGEMSPVRDGIDKIIELIEGELASR